MKRKYGIIVTSLVSMLMPYSVQAQKFSVNVDADSTFNAAEDYTKAAEGFDVDIKRVNEVNLGLQMAQDIAFVNANSDEATAAFPVKAYYRQRADLIFTAALPERTNLYTIFTFLNDNSGTSEAMVTFSNLELEHFFNDNFKIRMGRLVNKVSESQFFGRMALEESSAHIYGRNVFINDAIEFDGSFKKKGGPTFFMGLKPVFKPFNLKAVYAGLHQAFTSGMQVQGIVSVNRQFESDMTSYISDFKGIDSYFSYEAEVAYKQPEGSVYLNVGGNIDYRGPLPHMSGRYDLAKSFKPVITDRSESFKETFTAATGFRLRPSKISSDWKFLPQVGAEAEVQGLLTDNFTIINVCAWCKLNLTRRLVLTYYCTPEFIWQDVNHNKPRYIGGVSNFFRLTLTLGKPARMFL